MYFILLCIVAVALVVIGVAIGRATAKKHTPSAERQELGQLRKLTDSLYDQAADHIALGDSFAPIVFDEIRSTRKELA